jgi:hypothetical protein
MNIIVVFIKTCTVPFHEIQGFYKHIGGFIKSLKSIICADFSGRNNTHTPFVLESQS